MGFSVTEKIGSQSIFILAVFNFTNDFWFLCFALVGFPLHCKRKEWVILRPLNSRKGEGMLILWTSIAPLFVDIPFSLSFVVLIPLGRKKKATLW